MQPRGIATAKTVLLRPPAIAENRRIARIIEVYGKMAHAVLVRAFRGKPLKREVTGSNGRLVYVATPETIAPEGINGPVGIGFPAEDVFRFNSMAYEELCADFGRAGEISRAEWREKGLQRYEP